MALDLLRNLVDHCAAHLHLHLRICQLNLTAISDHDPTTPPLLSIPTKHLRLLLLEILLPSRYFRSLLSILRELTYHSRLVDQVLRYCHFIFELGKRVHVCARRRILDEVWGVVGEAAVAVEQVLFVQEGVLF